MIINQILLFILSYSIGSFPTAYIVVRKLTGKDIRQEGTGNVGAMNTARATGKWYLFLLVMILDLLKGSLAVSLTFLFLKQDSHSLQTTLMITSFGVVLGHCYSFYFKVKDGKFAGGKAQSTIAGVLLVLSFKGLLIPWFLVLILPVLLTGNLFLGQLLATIALPIIAAIFVPAYFWTCAAIAVPVLIKQWPRVIPMLQGKEPKWYWKNKERSKKA